MKPREDEAVFVRGNNYTPHKLLNLYNSNHAKISESTDLRIRRGELISDVKHSRDVHRKMTREECMRYGVDYDEVILSNRDKKR